MKPLAIIYGSSGDNTKSVARTIAAKFPDATLIDVAHLLPEQLNEYTNLIFGTSTWGLGDLQDDWEGFLPNLKKANLDAKTIALFGLGDSSSYSDTFVDGMGIIYEAICNKGCNIIGQVSVSEYNYDASRADNGVDFVGLALDEENESELTDQRVNNWIADIASKFQ